MNDNLYSQNSDRADWLDLRCPTCGRWLCAVNHWHRTTEVRIKCAHCKVNIILKPQEQSEKPVLRRS